MRNGTCSIFAFVEPLGGRHHTTVHEHRTALDWAEEIKYLVDEMYPDAEKIILVMDNLNTHKVSSLYKACPPAEARRITKCLEWTQVKTLDTNHVARSKLSHHLSNKPLVLHTLQNILPMPGIELFCPICSAISPVPFRYHL